ncbi:hypothetical protein C8R44DRAFT_877535 [Mycena epipterygia]|nr:hypothetical protein C8R44DRAFT_877535 [Mycena epipterygia]
MVLRLISFSCSLAPSHARTKLLYSDHIAPLVTGIALDSSPPASTRRRDFRADIRHLSRNCMGGTSLNPPAQSHGAELQQY